MEEPTPYTASVRRGPTDRNYAGRTIEKEKTPGEFILFISKLSCIREIKEVKNIWGNSLVDLSS